MVTAGQKRSHSDESSNIDDIDEEALLVSDEERDVTDELNMSDEEDDKTPEEGTTGQTERGLNLRDYQKELTEIALRGENTIIYAAKGAGKTRIAFYVVKKHLESNQLGKVAIMADNTLLMNQHFLALKKIMPEQKDKALCMSGQKEISDQLHMLIDDFSIVIVTPALIENTIKRHDPNFMSKFSLLVFDECQHTQKKTNYNRLMTRYHVLKSQHKKLLPQIVGLTATLGTNKANSVEKAKENVLTVMANLDVSKISSVTKNTQEYEEFRKDVKSDKIVLPETCEHEIVHRRIEEYMSKTEDLICLPLGNDVSTSEPDDADLDALATVLKKRTSVIRHDPQYITWTSELSTAAARLLRRQPEIATKVTIGASYLKIYCEVLGINDELTSIFATKVLDKKLRNQQFGSYCKSENPFEIQFNKLARDLMSEMTEMNKACADLSGKKVNELRKLLKEYCNKNQEESRYIVFVNTRDISEMLTEFLKTEGFKCSAFLGSSSTSDVGGTSRADQENVLKEFKEGKIHGIIATNVLEEGFDIPDCDFVIQYNYVGNEISTRQAKGRIRKQKGKRIILSKNKDMLRETLNVQREYLMDDTMQYILSMPENDIREFLQNEQRKIVLNERTNEQRQNVAKVPKLDGCTL